MPWTSITFALLLVCVAACHSPRAADGPQGGDWRAKIRFDLDAIDAAGLVGPPDGLRSLAYEFCIPDDDQARATVQGIDPKAQFFRSPGHIGCGKGTLLVLSDTYRKNWRAVLEQLASLDLVAEIRRAHFE